ncbi:chromate efflux transporter [Neptunomonas qingdaonensis]|uniref:Chromate transporter n=1 Tax=Neptunomonas qingdaonensis TaxID=1045558 RepID=A0A1I2U2P4_9GAMM|nr:chromate efflux transporter [Neptunomonas qingdaonensis]SFG69937.1 chromate transporter [Neptunomonas qingdaonensis]
MSEVKQEAATKGNVTEVFKTFLKLGLTSFGGPIAHIGYFRKEIIERQGWVSESQFSQLLAICQFIPGPASSQLGFSLGLLRAGWLGAIAAFIAFTLPSVIMLLAFALALPVLDGHIGESAIHGLKLVACAVVADAVLSMSKKLCPDIYRQSLAVLAACALLLMGSVWAQILVVCGGAIAGMVCCRESAQAVDNHTQVTYGKRLGLVLLAMFLFLLLALGVGPEKEGLYSVAQAFYNAGAMVFGGGHVVLPLLEDSVVATGWVSNESFLAGYGAAQAIPGPMFAFSAYLGAIIPTEHGSWLVALVALTFMFLPGFLLVAAVLPLWQAISVNPIAVNAIAGVNAVVVGILGAALYDPILTSGITSGSDLAIALVALGMLTIWRLSPLYVVVWCLFASVLSALL